jgi:hypothetical protein
MASTSAARTDIGRKWWLWPFVPFVLLASGFGILVFIALMGVAWPFMMIRVRREQRKIKRKLNAERRLVSWDDAVLARDEGKNLVLEFAPKAFGSMWLFELSPEARETLIACPTYLSWEADPRSAIESCMDIDKSRLALLEPYSQVAKRIEDRPVNLSDLDEPTKDSIRILPVFCEVSPTHFLYQWLHDTHNA